MKKAIIIFNFMLFAAISSFAGGTDYSAIALCDPTYLYKEVSDGVLEWFDTIDAGTALEGFDKVQVPSKINKTANSYNNKYINVYYKNQSVWTLANGIAKDYTDSEYREIGVIKEDCAVYTWPDRAAFEPIELPVGTVVAIFSKNDYESEGLLKVSIYDKQTFWKVRNVYILEEKITTQKGDYDAVVLAKTAMAKNVEKEKDLIAKLISNAYNRCECEEIYSYVQNVEKKIEEGDISQSSVSTISKSAHIASDGSKVNVREKPGRASKAIGQLEDKTSVRVTKKTTRTETISKETDSWYFVSSSGDNSVEGWVFGSSLYFEK